MFKFVRFGSTDLPQYGPDYDAGAMASAEVFADVAGGTFDAGGDEQLMVGRSTITHKGILLAESAADFETKARALLQLRGTRASLVRQWRDGGEEWINARCTAVQATRGAGQVLQQEYTFVFVLLGAAWNGSAHSDTITLNTSPKAGTITNNGDAAVLDAVITITAGSSAITSCTIALADAELQFTGTIAAGTSCIIDAGAMSIKNNGTDAYADFTLGSNHADRFWLTMPPGSNATTITYAGGGTGSTVQFDFYDAYH